MTELARIGVAIEGDLLGQFDGMIAKRGYASRSEAFRDLIRDALLQEQCSIEDGEVVGTVTLVYDHHVRLLSDKLTALQHEFHDSMLSTLHVHLDHDHCLEVIVVRGQAALVKQTADALISIKGVTHGRLTVTTTGATHDKSAGHHAHDRGRRVPTSGKRTRRPDHRN